MQIRGDEGPRIVLRATRWHETCKRAGLVTDASRARALGVTAPAFFRIQNGERHPSLQFIARACAYFHCPIDLLFEVVP